MSTHLREMWRAATRRTAMDYWMGHRPTETGPPAHDLLAPDPEYDNEPMMPADIYDRPDYYTGFRQWLPETMATLRAARGNPNATITIYRAQRKGTGLNTGDWVTLSRAYAEQDLGSYDEKNEGGREVNTYRVPASTVRYAGDDLMEWGYWGGPVTRIAALTKAAARMDPDLIRAILAAKPWRNSRTAEVMAGSIPGLVVDPTISSGLAGHAYRADQITLAPSWERDDEFGRFLLLTHELGHSVPVDKVQAHPEFAEVFGPHVGGGRYQIGNPWGANEFLSEVVADGYSEMCIFGPQGRYEDSEYVGSRALRIISEVARDAGMPYGKVEQ